MQLIRCASKLHEMGVTGKAGRNEDCMPRGVRDSRSATQLLNKLSVQYSFKRIQVYVLSAIFLLKKG
jgi:hypothetical protein